MLDLQGVFLSKFTKSVQYKQCGMPFIIGRQRITFAVIMTNLMLEI